MSRNEYENDILFQLLETARQWGHVGDFAEELLAQAAEVMAGDRRNRAAYDRFAEALA